MQRYSLLKEAGFIEGFLRELAKVTEIRTKPFEVILGAVGPLFIWRVHPILGALALALSLVGYGFGKLGSIIDQALGIGSTGVTKGNLSDSNLLNAAKKSFDKALMLIGLKSKAALEDIIMVKGYLDLNDFVAAAAISKDAPIIKEASRLRMLRTFIRKGLGGRRLGLINGLYLLLKTFAKGLIVVGVAKGIKEKVVGPSIKPQPGILPPSKDPLLPTHLKKGNQYYKNVSLNVENTLITFLDATIANFSDAFRKIHGRSLRGSKEMKSILGEVEMLNWGRVSSINKRDAFIAPSVLNIAKKILPQAKYEPIQAATAPKKPTTGLKSLYQGVTR